jgi:UDP-glucose 4-epimerase/UDP-glucuronate decarboxylase
LAEPRAYEAFAGAYDHVYLLASIVGVQRVENEPAAVLRTNTLIILNTLEWMARSGSKRLFFSSTSENYAGGFDYDILPIPTPEDVPLVISDIRNPRFSYAVTKIWGEAAAIAFGARRIRSRHRRYYNVYPRSFERHSRPVRANPAGRTAVARVRPDNARLPLRVGRCRGDTAARGGSRPRQRS